MPFDVGGLALRVPREVQGQNFERGFPVCGGIQSKIDFTHSASADPFQDFIVADHLTDQQISLSVFDDPRSKRGDRLLDETPRSLM
jgi:hypothetical protein